MLKQASDLKNSLAQGATQGFSAAAESVGDLQKLWDKSPVKDVPTREEMLAAFLTARLNMQQIQAAFTNLTAAHLFESFFRSEPQGMTEGHGANQDAAVAIYERLEGAREEFLSTVLNWKRRAGVRSSAISQ